MDRIVALKALYNFSGLIELYFMCNIIDIKVALRE